MPAHLLQSGNKGGRIDGAEGEVTGHRQVPLKRCKRGFNLFEVGYSTERSHDLDPAAVGAGSDSIDLVKGVIAVLRLPQGTGRGIEGKAEAVAAAVRKDLTDVRHHLTQVHEHRERQAGVQ